MDSKRLLGGVVGGLAGGILFGALMHMMGMLGMVAGLVGQDSTGVGWVVHLGISALFGIGYGLTLGAISRSWGHALGYGAVYGIVWWVLGALLILPARMGMPVFQIGEIQLQSLMGHILYGLTLGVVFQGFVRAGEGRQVASRA
ncbi:MAG: hypothetical protein ACR2KP_14130 [Egibacteraceae bacterium]